MADNTQMNAGPPVPASAVPILTAEQLRELDTARESGRRIRRAVSAALFDAWSIGIFAALTFLLSLGSVWGMGMGLLMGVIACVEFREAQRLRRLDASALRRLALNQLALAALLIVYAVWNLLDPGIESALRRALPADDPQIRSLVGSIEQLVRIISTLVYGTLILVAVAVQGSMAAYYLSRSKYVREHLRRTPQWIIQMQQAGISL